MTRIVIFLSIVGSINCSALLAQSNWVNRMNYSWVDANQYLWHDSVCGVLNAAQGPDGNIYLVAKVSQDNWENLIKIGPDGGEFMWSLYEGKYHSISKEEASSLRATSDSGCILLVNNSGWADIYFTDANILKYSSDGTVQWSKWFLHNDADTIRLATDLIQNASGNYYVLFADSLFELDQSGNVILGTNAIGGKQMFELSGGDLLVRTSDNTLGRMDLSGNVSWMISSVEPSDEISFSEAAVFICKQSGQLTKVDVSTGDTAWSISVPVNLYSSIDATLDGGVILAVGEPLIESSQTDMSGELLKYDADGNLEWDKSYNFPHFGLSYVRQLPSGKYFTGGTYLAENYMTCPTEDYNGFAAIVDSSGNGDLSTASYLWPSDADANDTVQFTTDGLVTATVLGATGTPRDHENFYGMIHPIYEWANDYAIDWTQSFSNGINYKQADFNGDGMIDSLDLNYPIAFEPIIIYCKDESPSQAETLPDFKLVAEHDVVAPGDVMKFYVVAGSSTLPVNSLYGVAAVLNVDGSLLDNSVADVVAISSDFGIPGIDLYKYGNTSNIMYGYIMSMLFCRTNQSNVSQLADTIGYIELKASSSISTPAYFNLTFNSFNAITADLAKVPFNAIDATVLIDPTYTGNNNPENKVDIYPNPASQFLVIKSFSNDEKRISIIDGLGRNVKDLQFSSKENTIDINDLQSGNYSVRIDVNGKESFSSVVIQR